MLERLRISNFVLIPSLELDFNDGMSVITGETGSGKSILLGAISLILGSKADKEEIRAGADRAELEAVFVTKRKSLINFLDEKGIDAEDGRIIIRRQIKSNGRSIYTVNGNSITISEGLEIGRRLVDLTGQNTSLSLTKKEMQRSLLDSSDDIKKALEKYQRAFYELEDLKKKEELLKDRISKIEDDRAFIEYSLDELEKADLKIGEDDEIKEKIKIASSAEALSEYLNSAKEAIDSSSRSLSAALINLNKAKGKDERLSELYSRLETSAIDIDDILSEVAEKSTSYSFDEYELEEMNSRLAMLQRIRKKYGGSIEMAIKKRDELKTMLFSSEEDDAELERISRQIENKQEEISLLASNLRLLRIKRSEKLSKDITKTLHKLSMNNATFKIAVEASALMTPYGSDNITFLIQANKGEKMSTLENAASGGELSRIMLAIKSNFLDYDDAETLIFDEIDTGISGHAASDVADVMKMLSKKAQIIAITHLAQIASKADNHILVEKSEEKGRTVSSLRYLFQEDKVKEIARLLSGDESEISLEHAKSLIS